MERDDMRYTGCFVICHFGPHENTGEAPVYLGDTARGCTPFTFTGNICKAQTFAYKFAAEEALKRENKYLEEIKHPLRGHLCIAEIYTRPLIEPKEDK